MNEQDIEPIQDIDRNLRKLIRGLAQNDLAEMCEGYKALFQVGAPAIPQIRAAVFKSNWSNLKYPNEIRYVSGLINLIIESTLYHEIGHHVHRHTFGEDPDQERGLGSNAAAAAGESRPNFDDV